MKVIYLTPEQLEIIIAQVIRRTLNIKQIGQDLSDRCSFNEALGITGFSKSALYKKTMNKTIPFKHYGKRLIFSRKELIAWMEANTYSKIESEVEMEHQIIKEGCEIN